MWEVRMVLVLLTVCEVEVNRGCLEIFRRMVQNTKGALLGPGNGRSIKKFVFQWPLLPCHLSGALLALTADSLKSVLQILLIPLF